MQTAKANSTWIDGVAETVSRAARGQAVRLLFSNPRRLAMFQQGMRSHGLRLTGDRWIHPRGGWVELRMRTATEQWAIDERELRRFLDSGTSEFEGSTFGAMLSRAALFAFGSTDCKACRERFPCTTCRRCKRGEPCRRPTFGAPTGFVGNTVCLACEGRGVIERKSRVRARGPITARSTCPPPRGSGHTLDETEMSLHGRVSSAWNLLTEHAPHCARALRLYHDPIAGGIAAVWEVTETGRAVAMRLHEEDTNNLSARQLLERLDAAAIRDPDDTKALQAIRRESKQLMHAAKRAYQAALQDDVAGVRAAAAMKPVDALKRAVAEMEAS